MSQSLCFVNPKIPHSIHRNISFSAYAVIWLIHWLAMLVLSVSIPAFLSFAEPAPVIFFEVSLLAFHSCLLPALSSSALLHALLPKWFLRLFSLSCFSNPHGQVLNGQHCTWSLCHPALTCMSSLLPPSHRVFHLPPASDGLPSRGIWLWKSSLFISALFLQSSIFFLTLSAVLTTTLLSA